MVMVVRASEQVVGIWTSTVDIHFENLSPQAKEYLKRRSRATRGLEYRIADFVNFSLNVPVVLSQEIWNQLVFSLSL